MPAGPRPLSRSQLERLGRRLRTIQPPQEEDLQLLQEFRAAHDPALIEVEDTLRAMRLRPTSRLKTPSTIIEKLIRQRTRLGSMQDIAGVRIVEDMSLDDQDQLVRRIVDRLGGEDIDRRRETSFGYRAVHIICPVQGCLVEIQVRTYLQNLWAQIMEALGDRYGRGIRYGEPSKNLREVVEHLIEISEKQIGSFEEAKNDLERRETDLFRFAPPEDLAELEEELSEFEQLKAEIKETEERFRTALGEILDDLEGRSG